ncbi:MAG TPA: adenylate/guanylate cyclase domain-containing protein [Solirubrobacterales bacterium]|nr:adenylate/guanylate cyclase domain-containing protein [Solirubrobacterales bacterium]
MVGDGDLDLLWIPGFVSNVELAWEEPLLARYLNRLARFSRLILFDKRGTGLSDRVPRDELPSLEERMDDVIAVLDAVGSERAAVMGHSEGGNLAVLYAATHPGRVIALVTTGIFAYRKWAPEYPWAEKPEERARYIEQLEDNWGADGDIHRIAPSAARDPEFTRRLATYFRQSASPGDAAALLRMNTEIDIRAVLPTISVPTMVIHRSGDRDSKVEEGRWIAGQIPEAELVELPGDDHLPWVGDQDRVIDEAERFLTGRLTPAEPDRVLATILVTDIVGSTERAAELGDEAWKELLERHHSIVREQLRAFRGEEVDTAGDGFLATFDGPGRAIRAAVAIRNGLLDSGIEVRCGLHTGECERVGGKVAGIAVHIAARVANSAEPGEIRVSDTVRALVAGAGIEFSDRGAVSLRGVPEEQRLFAVEHT